MPIFHKRPMLRHGLAGLAALLLGTSLPVIAHAQDDDSSNALLIAILVKRGVITKSDAAEIMHQVQVEQEARAAARPAPAPPAPPRSESATIVSSTTTPDGTIHVTYIPRIVRDQITAQVKQEVLAQEQAQGYAAPDEVPDWVKHIHIYGDFRARYESDLFPRGNANTGAFPNFNSINTGSPYDTSQSNLNFPSQNNVDQNRDRFRIRARIGLDADLGEGFTLGFRLATGENDSPVSENQTLGGAPNGAQGGEFSKYAIWIDRAHLDYTLPPVVDGLKAKFMVGRFDNPFFSTSLIYADDLGFDGVAGTTSYDTGFYGLTPFVTAGAFPIYDTDFNFASNQPSKYASRDKYLFGAQLGTDLAINDDYAAKLAVAYYDYSNIAGKLSSPCIVNSAADVCDTDDTRPSFAQNGNTYFALRDIVPTVANNNGTTLQYQYFGLASNFRELALTGEVDFSNFDPLAHIWVNGEYVKNLGFDKSSIAAKAVNNRGPQTATSTTGDFVGGNTGYFIYGNVGQKELNQRWDWHVTLGYKYVESDAVVDGLDDSDFGLGGTNLKGYIAGADLAISPQVFVRLRYLSADAIAGPTYRADVLQLDMNAKF